MAARWAGRAFFPGSFPSLLLLQYVFLPCFFHPIRYIPFGDPRNSCLIFKRFWSAAILIFLLMNCISFRSPLRLALLLVLLICSQRGWGQGPLNLLAHTEGGAAYEVCFHGGLLYVGAANTLMVYDLSGPGHIPGNKLQQRRFGSNITQMLVHNGFLYLCANHDGLWKLDLTANPANPPVVAHWAPADLDESLYDVAFKGDSIVLAAKRKLLLLKDNGGSFGLLQTISSLTGTGRFHGVDIKDNLLAYTVGLSAVSDGVGLVDLDNLQQLGFYSSTLGDPLEVYFGQGRDLLHVLGGTIFNLFTKDGLYFALEYSNPASMTEVFRDTLPGFGLLSISQPMSAELLNDTLYIATQGALPAGGLMGGLTGNVWVYDGSQSGSVSLVGSVYAGLYHFDLAIDAANRVMHVASEWYGVLSMDIRDLQNASELGRVRTGGWCSGSAAAQDRLVEASEGHGIRLFDIADPSAPLLLAEDTAVGFARAVSISDSGDYVYGWFLTNANLRVFQGDSLDLVGDYTFSGLGINGEFEKSRHEDGRIAVIRNPGPNSQVLVADVSNPALPILEHVRRRSHLKDLVFLPGGSLLAVQRDSLVVFNAFTMAIWGGALPSAGPGQQFMAATYSQDTLYVFSRSNSGQFISKYTFGISSAQLTFISSAPFAMGSAYRVHLAADDSLLYISGSLDELQAVTKSTPHVAIAEAVHSADFIRDDLWGVTDLYRAGGLLFHNHYFGQTSIYGPAAPLSIGGGLADDRLLIFPNPSQGKFTLDLPPGPGDWQVLVFGPLGQRIYEKNESGGSFEIDLGPLPRGHLHVVARRAGEVLSGTLWIRD